MKVCTPNVRIACNLKTFPVPVPNSANDLNTAIYIKPIIVVNSVP